MKLGCSSMMLAEPTITEKARKLKTLGFDGISVFINYANWNETLLMEIVELESNTGIVPCEFVFSSSIYGHLMDPDRNIQEKSRRMYKDAAQISAMIGAVTELEYACYAQDPLPLYQPYKKLDREGYEKFIEMYAELHEPLDGSNAYMLLENLNRYESPFFNTLADCSEVVQDCGLSRAGVLADFFHMSIEESDISQAIYSAGSLIKHVHLGDSNRLIPGRGFIDWKAGFDALKKIGYNGYCCLECALLGNRDEDLKRAVSFLKPLM
jgi:sugar phosphate isomerase/epimerase